MNSLTIDGAGERIEWFLDGELLAGLDEEYRRRNARFRRHTLETLLRTPSHPLRFLLSVVGRWHRSRSDGPTWDAGHVIPVAQLKKMGATLERLAVQDRRLNRSSGARRIRRVVAVGGVPVDLRSLEQWASVRPSLRRFTTDAYVRRNTVRGWSSRTGQVERELEPAADIVFVVAGDGRPWARTIDRRVGR